MFYQFYLTAWRSDSLFTCCFIDYC